MIRDPKDLQRYTASERANHWLVGIAFILLALSGLALFHPLFWPLTNLFGGGTSTATVPGADVSQLALNVYHAF